MSTPDGGCETCAELAFAVSALLPFVEVLQKRTGGTKEAFAIEAAIQARDKYVLEVKTSTPKTIPEGSG